MSDLSSPACPHCGSHKLIAHRHSRTVFINHDGESIPLLTVNYSLDRPVGGKHEITYTCSCSWAGNTEDLMP